MVTQETGSLRRFIFASVVLHGVLVALLALLAREEASLQSQESWTYIELESPKVPPPRPASKDEIFPNHRIVQTERGELAKKPDKNAFLGEKTQTVDRQTVSKSHSIAMGHQASRTKPLPPAAVARHETPVKSKSADLTPLPPLKQLGVAILPDARELARRNAIYDRDEPQWANQDGDHTPQDYIPGITESHETALNTREYRFFGYYQRIRSKLDGAWIPILRGKLKRFYFAGRHLASDMDHTTRVMVVLNLKGEIIRIQVLSRSGTMDLDDAAVEAFNRAGPFPNPPKGLVDQNGEIRVPWEFIIHS